MKRAGKSCDDIAMKLMYGEWSWCLGKTSAWQSILQRGQNSTWETKNSSGFSWRTRPNYFLLENVLILYNLWFCPFFYIITYIWKEGLFLAGIWSCNVSFYCLVDLFALEYFDLIKECGVNTQYLIYNFNNIHTLEKLAWFLCQIKSINVHFLNNVKESDVIWSLT